MARAHGTSPAGQASVELAALLPLIALGTVVLVQVLLAAHAAWAAEQAAHSAARAQAVGLDALAAARTALPPHLDRRMRLRTSSGGAVELRLRVPTLLRALDLGSITTRARFEPQG